MELQSLIDQWESEVDRDAVERYNATQADGNASSGWTVEWVFQALLGPHRVRASYQEEEALRNFERAQSEGVR